MGADALIGAIGGVLHVFGFHIVMETKVGSPSHRQPQVSFQRSSSTIYPVH